MDPSTNSEIVKNCQNILYYIISLLVKRILSILIFKNALCQGDDHYKNL